MLGVQLIPIDYTMITDMQVNQALAHQSDVVDIYQNSWGVQDSVAFYTNDMSSINSMITVSLIIMIIKDN